jgi:mRNA interferase MazF
MVMTKYVPDTGDIVWLQFNPQTGKEQAGHRPALVLSPKAYNSKTSLMLCCPMTTQIKNYPFEVKLNREKIPSAILSDQIKSLDWKKREATFKSKAPPEVLQEVSGKIKALLGL